VRASTNRKTMQTATHNRADNREVAHAQIVNHAARIISVKVTIVRQNRQQRPYQSEDHLYTTHMNSQTYMCMCAYTYM